MKLRRLLTLAGVALFALTGCSKEITYAEAMEHVKTNYTGTEKKTIKYVGDVTVNKAEGIFSEVGEFFEPGHHESTDKEVPMDLEYLANFKEGFKFYQDGKKLTCKVYANSGDDLVEAFEVALGFELPVGTPYTITGVILFSMSFDENGYFVGQEEKYVLNFVMSSGGITMEGFLDVAATMTGTIQA